MCDVANASAHEQSLSDAEALDARVETGRQRVKARTTVEALVKRGGRAVRVLNAILTAKLAGTPISHWLPESVRGTFVCLLPASLECG